MEHVAQNQYGTICAWVLAARPKTLPASMAPVSFAAWLAWNFGRFNLSIFLIILFTALLIQIGTNFANDLWDFKKGADTATRKGPLRTIQAGLISPNAMLRAMLFTLGLALTLGVYLVYLGGFPILMIGVAALLCAWGYTAGPFPLAYLGLGDIFVFAFFGPIATAGTYLILAGEFSSSALLCGAGFGAISTAILVVNNLRDVEEDRLANKRTSAVRFGIRFARYEYLCLITFAAIIVPLTLFLLEQSSAKIFASSITLAAATPLILTVFRISDSARLNKCLENTGKLLLLYGLLLAVGMR